MRQEGGGVPFATELLKRAFTAGMATHEVDSNEEGIQGRIALVINNMFTSETIPQDHWATTTVPRFNDSMLALYPLQYIGAGKWGGINNVPVFRIIKASTAPDWRLIETLAYTQGFMTLSSSIHARLHPHLFLTWTFQHGA